MSLNGRLLLAVFDVHLNQNPLSIITKIFKLQQKRSYESSIRNFSNTSFRFSKMNSYISKCLGPQMYTQFFFSRVSKMLDILALV